jgi:HPt (histidine-containing phosphotransfer) domain-containing protein
MSTAPPEHDKSEDEDELTVSVSDFDFEYFDGYTSGDDALQREVLQLFFGQISSLLDKFSEGAAPDVWQSTAHAIKGSAHGVGMSAVADLAEHMEGEAAHPEETRQATLERLATAVATARSAVEGQYSGIFSA